MVLDSIKSLSKECVLIGRESSVLGRPNLALNQRFRRLGEAARVCDDLQVVPGYLVESIYFQSRN